MGDDTWKALFNEYIHPDFNFPYDSLNVWDLDTVDNGVIEHLFPLISKENCTKWDLLVGIFRSGSCWTSIWSSTLFYER